MLSLGVPDPIPAPALPENRDIDGRAHAIGAAWRRGVAAILETARLTAVARVELGDDDLGAGENLGL